MLGSRKNCAVLGAVVALAAAGCGGAPSQHVNYARARPLADEPTPVPKLPMSIAVASRSFSPLQAASTMPIETPPQPKPSYEVIDHANQAAAQGPVEGGFSNAIHDYVYTPGALYQIYGAPMRVTDLSLEPGERVVGPPASGDPVRWIAKIGKSFENGVEQQHLYLKPMQPGLATNMIINTTKRSYFLELHSYEQTYQASVRWRYPQEELDKMTADAQAADTARTASTPMPSLDKLNFGYRIKVMDGEPRWTPTQVFDDGRHTFIRFPNAMLVREAPVLFVMREAKTQLVNYRVKHNMYIVDRLFDEAELRVGQDDPEIVRIRAER